MPKTPDLITTSDASEILEKSVATINRWADSGKLPVAHKHDGLRGPRLFRRADVLRLTAAKPKAEATS